MPDDINQPKTLHELVSSAINDSKNRKVVGYSIPSYVGVLSALEKAKLLQNSESENTTSQYSEGSNMTVTSRSWSMLSNYGLDSSDIMNEFYQSNLNQVRVILRDYMTFVLDCTTDDGKIERTCVNRRDYQHLTLMDKGMSISSSQSPQFPPGVWTTEGIDHCKNGISGENEDGFIIGLGVAFNQLVINYFKHFYPKMEFQEHHLKSLAARGFLYGELMIPKGNNNAKVLHSRITVDISQSNSSSYDVFVPVPLMLLNDFKDIGYVKVRNNSVEENVDGNKLKFPFADKKYNHKTSVIEGFSPDAVRDYVPGSSRIQIEYRYTGLNGGKEVQGRMRFYFSPESQENIVSTTGKEIPEEYKVNLFRGVLEESGYYKSESVVSFDDSPVEVGIFSNSVYYPDDLRDVISKDHYAKALSIIRCAEIGTYLTKPGSCEWNVANDGAGITYGSYQTTGKSGGLLRLINNYISDPNSMETYVNMINTYKSYVGEYGRKSASSGVRSLMNALKQAGNNDPNMAICQSRHVYEEQIKAKGLINAFKNSGCKSPLAFTIALHCYNQGRPRNFWSGVASASDEKTKCILMIQNELAFLRRMSWWPNPATEKTSNHIRWTNDYIKAARNGNFNLNQVQRWCNATF